MSPRLRMARAREPRCRESRLRESRPRESRLRESRLRESRLRSARGQATLEALALVPLFVALGLGCLQLLAVGYASVLAGNAAEAGALALARGGDPRVEAQRALPGWSEAGARVEVEGGRVRVRVRPPSPLRALANRLEVTSSAAVEAP